MDKKSKDDFSSNNPPNLNLLEDIEEVPENNEIKFKNLGAGSHWEKPAAAVSNDTVIALPAAEFPQD